MQGSNEPFRADMPAARLSLLALRSSTVRGQVPPPSRYLSILTRDMFSLVWGPTLRSVASLLEAAHPEDAASISDGMSAVRAVRPHLAHSCGELRDP
jgi:hypothetical protein